MSGNYKPMRDGDIECRDGHGCTCAQKDAMKVAEASRHWTGDVCRRCHRAIAAEA